MKLQASLYRIIKIPLQHLLTAAGVKEGYNDAIEPALRKTFGLLAPRFRIFADQPDPNELVAEPNVFAYCGVEVMRFSLRDFETPSSGLVTADPMDPRNVQMADGALASELERMGIDIDPREIEWRMSYEVTGN